MPAQHHSNTVVAADVGACIERRDNMERKQRLCGVGRDERQASMLQTKCHHVLRSTFLIMSRPRPPSRSAVPPARPRPALSCT